MLTVPCPQEFLVTLRLHRATLRHHTALPEQSWHSQVREGRVGGVGWARADLGLEPTSGWSPWARV